ncbi:MAG: hypothetical protein E6P95_01340 [Candidatus Moraniibacteriota bacterium]|nr:MAG: hypothetical protein E6P95_01340 [Candidatus Moranbacteria bacterium]
MYSSSSDPVVDDKRNKRRQLESQLFSLEADRSHLEREQVSVGTSLQGLRQNLRQLEAQIEASEADLNKIEGKLLVLNADIQKIKKGIRLL